MMRGMERKCPHAKILRLDKRLGVKWLCEQEAPYMSPTNLGHVVNGPHPFEVSRCGLGVVA